MFRLMMQLKMRTILMLLRLIENSSPLGCRRMW